MADVDAGGSEIPTPLTRALFAIIGSALVFLWLYLSRYRDTHPVVGWSGMNAFEWFHLAQFATLSCAMARASKWRKAAGLFCGAAIVAGSVLTPLVPLSRDQQALLPVALTIVAAVVLVSIVPPDIGKSPSGFLIGFFWASSGVYVLFAGFHLPMVHDYLRDVGDSVRTGLLVAFLVVGLISLVVWWLKKWRPSLWVLIAPALGGAAVFIGWFNPHGSVPHAGMDLLMGLCSFFIVSTLWKLRKPQS